MPLGKMQQMSLEHTQITSWGLSVPFCIFFFFLLVPNAVPGTGEEVNNLLMVMIRMYISLRLTGR